MINFDYVCHFFIKKCIENNLAFTSVDILNFSVACNVEPEYKLFKSKILKYNFENYNQHKPLLGPIIFFPKSIENKKRNINISKIMLELKLENQNISPDDKMDKILNYINYIY